MENSMTSMSKDQIHTKGRTVDSDEESSWTFYFEDFLCDNNNNEHSSFSSGYESPSLVADATSSVAKKFMDTDQVAGLSLNKTRKSLSFKKRKMKGASVNEDLEDTASSPVNSPKVCYLNQLHTSPKEKDKMEISQEKGNASSQADERSELGIVGRDSDHTDLELKKRGLCLVPVSMLANYLG